MRRNLSICLVITLWAISAAVAQSPTQRMRLKPQPVTTKGLHAAALPSGVRFLPGPVNGLLVNGKVLVYGDSGGRVKEASHVLFTHARRDVVWAGKALVRDGSAATVPERER